MKTSRSNCILLGFIFLFISCSKEDDQQNGAPSKVNNIEANVLNGTMVNISWDAATHNGPVNYEVIVNDFVAGRGLLTTNIQLDVQQFLTQQLGVLGKNGIKEFDKSLGQNLVLGIEIRAFSSNGGFSSTVAVKTVNINRVPGQFSFENIYFDLDNFQVVMVVWSAASDLDGDSVLYDVYLNETIIEQDYSIQDGASGSTYYIGGFAHLVDQEITIKVIAKDGSSYSEISQKFNFRATDADLGTLTIPYQNTIAFNITTSEADNRVAYKFSTNRETGFSFKTDTDIALRLLNENRVAFLEGYKNVKGELLPAGTYYLEINNWNVSEMNISGNLDIQLNVSTDTDKDLDLVEIPSLTSFDFDLGAEIDGIVTYFFELPIETGFIFSTSHNISLNLYNESGLEQFFTNYGQGIKGILPSGKYSLKVSSYYVEGGSVSFWFKHATETDQNLGMLSVPGLHEYSYTLENEPDDELKYNFSIDSQTGYAIYSEDYLRFSLYTSSGNYVNSGYGRINSANLPEGSYELQIHNNSDISGSFSINFSDPTEGDLDLGLLSFPYDYESNLNFLKSHPDDIIAYTFRTNQIAKNYNITLSPGLYALIKRDNGMAIALVNTSTFSGENLPAGNYIIEIGITSYTVNESVLGSVVLQFTN